MYWNAQRGAKPPICSRRGIRASPLKLSFSQEFCNLPLNPRSRSADVQRTNGMRFPLSAKHPIDD